MRLGEFLADFGRLDDAGLAAVASGYLVELSFDRPLPDRAILLLRGSEELQVGRSQRCPVHIPDARVSSRHAQLVPPRQPRDPWKIADLGSTNGTWAGGVQVGDRLVALADRAAVRFGSEARYFFLRPESLVALVRALQGRPRAAEGPEPDGRPAALVGGKTDRILPHEVTGGGGGGAAPPEPDSGRTPAFHVLSCPPYDPVVLRPGQPVVIGRVPKPATFVLPHQHISRAHCEVVLRDGRVRVRDLGSANGTFIGQERVGPTPVEFLVGKVLRVGPFELLHQGPASEDLGKTRQDVTVAGPAAGAAEREVEHPLSVGLLVDLLLEVEGLGRTGRVEIGSGGLTAEITFAGGALSDAWTSTGLHGANAVRRVLGLTEGTCVVRLQHAAGPEPRGIPAGKRFGNLILEWQLPAF